MTENSDVIGHDEISLSERPLIVCDVDEVALEFLNPFSAYLRANGYELLPRSFRLTGNIVSLDRHQEASSETVNLMLDSFFAEQMDWQTPAAGSGKVLASLADHADIVFLTSMPTRHYEVRRSLLDRHGLNYPLIALEGDKGPVLNRIHSGRDHPLVFIDDLIFNLHSVRKHAPFATAIQYMSNDVFRSMAPDPGDDIIVASDWPHIEEIIRLELDT
ncbi:hypothetical protein [Hoeflea prorocentri]|uniref:Uncharacterized protein n=1 Tax=Hoeflea prorocentri TaxID=1922333 RepID=A0A9X3UFP5_9HYPH|nr:hypothetical protein [Hoeflea prorocentri]MCY6380478.1 hypothetical protein [Hoeflea prorocentri]MDA5398278.1 hypothetical protein [Hoeflea prorocentri]